MYPYDYTKDDNGLNLALMAPLFVAVYSAKHLSSGIRNFLWKNYWWICALVFTWIGSNYTGNFVLLLLFGAVGAFGGLIGASGFDPKDFRDDSSQNSSYQQPTTEGEIFPATKISEKQTTVRNQATPAVINRAADLLPRKQSTTETSDSAQAIIDSQRKIYDQGIWLKKATAANNQPSEKVIPNEISSAEWKHDKSKGILWNALTKETLHASSGLGYSLTKDHFILYNKVAPRKILRTEVTEGDFNS